MAQIDNIFSRNKTKAGYEADKANMTSNVLIRFIDEDTSINFPDGTKWYCAGDANFNYDVVKTTGDFNISVTQNDYSGIDIYIDQGVTTINTQSGKETEHPHWNVGYVSIAPADSNKCYGVVKTASDVTSKQGLTPVPIIGGVPYYREVGEYLVDIYDEDCDCIFEAGMGDPNDIFLDDDCSLIIG